MNKDAYIVTGKSESGDNYGPKSYNYKPKELDLKQFILDETPEEINCGGPGDFGSYVHLKVNKI